MMVVSTANGAVGIRDAMAVLRGGGSALDAVEAGTRRVELNAHDHTVGLGGLPNIVGEVRVDASIMDGRTLRAGAVGSVRGILHAITLARRVMERSPHVLLVADGAERFAREIGMAEHDLLTEEAASRWREGLAHRHPNVDPDGIAGRDRLLELVGDARDSMRGWDPPGPEEPAGTEEPHGTVNFLALDRGGNLASAVSTSGYPWGYPGRLGDSPIIGAGGYADNRWGAAASTGTGEVVLRTPHHPQRGALSAHRHDARRCHDDRAGRPPRPARSAGRAHRRHRADSLRPACRICVPQWRALRVPG